MKEHINLKELYNIWNDKGSHPAYHDAIKANLHEEWPLLWHWIDSTLKRECPPK